MLKNRIGFGGCCTFASKYFTNKYSFFIKQKVKIKSNKKKQLVKQLKSKNMNTNIKNSVRLIGNIGQAPEIRTFDNNKKMARFSLATNETYKNNKGERVTETQWHNIVAWGSVASIIETLAEKGSSVAIEGKLVNKAYTDKNGNKRLNTEIVLNQVQLLNPKKQQA